MKHLASIFFGIILSVGGSQAQNLLPQANLDLSPNIVRVGEYLNFDASGSRDSQGQARNLEYRFQVGNGEDWTSFSANSRGRFKPTKPGSDLIRLEIRDRISGTVQRTYRQYTVREERRPTPPRIKLLSVPPFAAGEQIGFEVVILTEPSLNVQDLLVAWDFNSDGVNDTPWQTDKRGYYIYPGGNMISPTVSVKYPNDRILTVRGIRSGQPSRGAFDYARDVDTLVINPTRIQSPIVDVSPGYSVPSQDTTFTFDASKTRLGSNSYLKFYFDGTKKYSGKTKVKHRFSSPGEHVVRILHCINRSQPECRPTEVRVTVADSSATTGTGFWVDFTANELQPGVRQFRINDNVYQAVVSSPIRFSGQVRITATGQRPKFEYRWDFDGDGSWDTPYSTQLSSEFAYDNAGTFKPLLEVRDDKGNISTTTKTMLVSKNTKPIGQIRTATWPNYAGEEIQFIVAVADGQSNLSQLDVRFDFDDDGIWDTDFRPTRSQRWRFDKAGKYPVTIQIRDPQREVTTVTRTIPVYDTPEPDLKVQVSHRTQLVGQPIRLSTAQTQGVGLSYEWKVLDDPYATIAHGPQTSLRFTTVGERTICLRVIDQAGQIKQIEFPINIVEALPSSSVATTSAVDDTAVDTLNPGLPKPVVDDLPGTGSEFSTETSEFIWSDYDLINRPGWKVTGMRPGP